MIYLFPIGIKFGIQSLSQTSDNGWIASVSRAGGSYNICKVDSVFNGFCNYSTFNSIITDFTPIVNSYSLTSININFIADTLNIISSPLPVYRGDECTSVEVEETKYPYSILYIYPNPFTDELSVRSSEFEYKTEIKIFDVTGKEILQQKTFEAETKINTAHLTPGFYFINYREENKSVNKKVVKLN